MSMKQKLIAAAVAGAFVVPGVAMAQVTISGELAVAYDSTKVSEPNFTQATAGANRGTAAAPFNMSSSSMTPDAKIKFTVKEDLGGGTEFQGYYEFRPVLDSAEAVANAFNVSSTSPPSYVGLANKEWGQFRAGTLNTWTGKGTGENQPTAMHYSAARLIDYLMTSATTTTSFGSGRWRNDFQYISPSMSGFTVQVDYSTAADSNDADKTVTTKKTSSWFLAPEYNAGFAKFGYAYAKMQFEATTNDLKAQKLWVNGDIGPISTGLLWAKVKGTAAGVAAQDVTRWFLPVAYKVGAHTFGLQYSKSRDDKVLAGDQSAKYIGVAYNYNLSKRTFMSVS